MHTDRQRHGTQAFLVCECTFMHTRTSPDVLAQALCSAEPANHSIKKKLTGISYVRIDKA